MKIGNEPDLTIWNKRTANVDPPLNLKLPEKFWLILIGNARCSEWIKRDDNIRKPGSRSDVHGRSYQAAGTEQWPIRVVKRVLSESSLPNLPAHDFFKTWLWLVCI